MGVLIAATMVFVGAPAAHAAPGDDQEKTDFYFAGVITFEEKPIEGVVVSVEGEGFDAETKTDADGRWRLYVPEKATYTLTVDESTLPDGVIVQGDSASQEVEFGLTGSKIVNLFLGEGERVTQSFLDQLMVRLVNGLNFGLLLALAAMGAALIYGTTGLSNFAHGEMVTWGAMVTLIVSVFWQGPLWLGILVALIAGLGLGLALDVVLWRPLRRRGLGVVQLMIVSIGLSLALRYSFQYVLGGSSYQLPGASPTPLQFGPISLSYIDLVSMGVSIVVILGVAYFLLRTRIGKATRAISDNPQLASASGINVDRIIRIVWIVAGGLAALSGILWAYFRPGLRWDMGTQMLLLIFAAITLGGLGTAFGALLGSLIVGIVVEASTLWIPSDLKYAGALVVLIVILLVRPQGLLGRKERLG
ncbi:branched-chain amino acid ABC transporter permease [Microbacterium ulmi]|uniref:Branched-chain amino acid ABC transporter permease n=1 Tax=Microbacterium ulmi TaxID=179095 RepID=A0A7Y2M156_9MICO|nr:branched-chain amino acid ABC transporter permease [Microbacterium ulmi]NII70194.1 branched-chain amino acid transport system permease protein [Microbacterium ulmi]NNH04544.1 branched-chain amino acid ABC transporter permease [Microbacterium ulmi]